MPESPIRKLAPLAAAAKQRGTKVYHLNSYMKRPSDRKIFIMHEKHVFQAVICDPDDPVAEEPDAEEINAEQYCRCKQTDEYLLPELH